MVSQWFGLWLILLEAPSWQRNLGGCDWRRGEADKDFEAFRSPRSLTKMAHAHNTIVIMLDAD